MARTHRKKPPISPEQQMLNDDSLIRLAVSTNAIRHHQEMIVTTSKEREEIVLDLRKNGVSYRAIAEAMGTSEQTVYKIIQPHLVKKEQVNDL